MAYGYGDSKFYSEYFTARPNPYLISVEVTRGNGCRTMSAQFEVYVEEKPIVEVTATETDICVGGSVTLTANLENYHMDDLTFQWYTTDTVDLAHEIYGATQYTYTTNALTDTGINKFSVRVYHKQASDNPYLFTVQVSNNRGCTTLSDEFPVYVNDSSSINVVVTSDYDSVCVGGEVTFRAHIADYNSRHLTFQWYKIDTTAAGVDTLIAIDYGREPWLTYEMTDTLWNRFALKITQTNSGCEAWGL